MHSIILEQVLLTIGKVDLADDRDAADIAWRDRTGVSEAVAGLRKAYRSGYPFQRDRPAQTCYGDCVAVVADTAPRNGCTPGGVMIAVATEDELIAVAIGDARGQIPTLSRPIIWSLRF